MIDFSTLGQMYCRIDNHPFKIIVMWDTSKFKLVLDAVWLDLNRRNHILSQLSLNFC